MISTEINEYTSYRKERLKYVDKVASIRRNIEFKRATFVTRGLALLGKLKQAALSPSKKNQLMKLSDYFKHL